MSLGLKRRARLVALAVVGVVAYFSLWPVPAQPSSWQAPQSRGYVGVHARNTRLAGIKRITLGGEEGPEHVALGRDGKLYAAVASGKVLRMEPDGSAQEVFASTGGRVLGFDFDAADNLIAADAMRGLLVIGRDRRVRVLVDQHGGERIRYADAVVVARSGKIYFSDASTRFAPTDWGGTFEASVLDLMEQSSTGRVLEYDPASRATRIVAKGLSFANGVVLSGDEHSLLVSETGKYRVWKVAIEARDLDVRRSSPLASVVLDNLPGFTDNLMRGQDGRIWLGFVKPRNPVVDKMADKPFLRELTLRLPRALWPVPKAYGHVIAFTEDGKVVADLQDPGGAYPETTGVTETAQRRYVQSLHGKGLGWMPR